MAPKVERDPAQVHQSIAAREHGGHNLLAFDPETKKLIKPPDRTWHDHLILLLNLGAAIEHALMVQYLFAAYTLGGEQVPKEHQPTIQRWQEIILSVAREEMGHLLTVQNVLTLLGAGINLNRENFPWDIQYYPFPFVLEPLTIGALACYVYAEMPYSEQFPERAEIARLAAEHAKVRGRDVPSELHPVGEIYSEIIDLISDVERIPESAFQEQTFTMQASWDDWGRRYGPDPQLLTAEGSVDDPGSNMAKIAAEKTPDPRARAILLIARMATRQQAVAALTQLSQQGEGPHGAGEGELSHFQRFMDIYRDFKKIEHAPWKPARNVAPNPTVQNYPGAPDPPGYMALEFTRNWGHLFNTRYRILLNAIAHTFRMARVTRSDEPSVRGVLMHRVFREMYNLKTIAGILVQLPLREGKDSPCAGPPFEMPFSLTLPPGEADAWQLHLDVLGSSQRLTRAILSGHIRPGDRAYLEALSDLDAQSRTWIETILNGLTKGERYPA